jgi:hypothetical protein
LHIFFGVSVCQSINLFARVKKFRKRWINLKLIWYLRVSLKYLDNLQIAWLKWDSNNGRFPKHLTAFLSSFRN